MTCLTCNGTGYDPHNGGHIFNNQEEMDGTHEHQCVHCPVPCPDCGGSGDDPMSDHFNSVRFGYDVRQYRGDVSLRVAQVESGVHFTTIKRIEDGTSGLIDNVAGLARWASLDLNDYQVAAALTPGDTK